MIVFPQVPTEVNYLEKSNVANKLGILINN